MSESENQRFKKLLADSFREVLREAEEGNWVTINGVHILIKDGESAADAFKRTTGKDLDGDSAKNLNKGNDSGSDGDKTSMNIEKYKGMNTGTAMNNIPDSEASEVENYMKNNSLKGNAKLALGQGYSKLANGTTEEKQNFANNLALRISGAGSGYAEPGWSNAVIQWRKLGFSHYASSQEHALAEKELKNWGL